MCSFFYRVLLAMLLPFEIRAQNVSETGLYGSQWRNATVSFHLRKHKIHPSTKTDGSFFINFLKPKLYLQLARQASSCFYYTCMRSALWAKLFMRSGFWHRSGDFRYASVTKGLVSVVKIVADTNSLPNEAVCNVVMYQSVTHRGKLPVWTRPYNHQVLRKILLP